MPSPKHIPTGFTLIELLVVIAVIGVLLALCPARRRQWRQCLRQFRHWLVRDPFDSRSGDRAARAVERISLVGRPWCRHRGLRLAKTPLVTRASSSELTFLFYAAFAEFEGNDYGFVFSVAPFG